MNGIRIVLRWIACVALGLLPMQAWADPSTSIEDLFKNPKFATATLSPNGKYLATTANIDGHLQLAVVDLETSTAKNIAGYDKQDVWGIRWINNDRLVFSIVDRDGDQISSASGLYALNRDGTKETVLMEAPERIHGAMNLSEWVSKPRWLTLIGHAFADNPNDLLAVGHFPNGEALPYRVDSLTGKLKDIDYDLNGLARHFVSDAQNRIRVVVTSNTDNSVETIWYREADSKTWIKLTTQDTFDAKLHVLALDADGTLIVSAPGEGGRWAVYKYDLAGKKLGELLAADKQVDVGGGLVTMAGGLVFAPDSHKLLGIHVRSEPPRTVWLDKTFASMQASLDKAMPSTRNVVTPSDATAPVLIQSYSSTEAGRYVLFYPDKKKLQNLVTVRPWMDPKKLSVQRAYDYTARDGLPILSYLTLPLGREPKALPMVVLVHGGPWARDHWGFNPEVQFLAGLGYAVLQPQFRGSTGFGDDHLRKSFAQWGLSMQDDVTDGVASLVQQGVVDPKRVCIMGSSYGGYATMQGLVKDPDQYRCGVNLFGVTNLFYISSSGDWGVKEMIFAKDKMLGDPGKLKDQFSATSPAKNADKVKAPVFMVYGEKDERVPLVHGEDMRDGLKRAGKVFEYMELAKEEHGIALEENRFKVYKAVEAFLRKYNPPQ